MGYMAWRERTLAKIDATADRLDEKAKRMDAEHAAMMAERAAVRADPLGEWYRSEAARLREDHADLAGRASALGMGLPVPLRRLPGAGFVHALGVITSPEDMNTGRRDPYREWRDQIVVEESMAAKRARGESLSFFDRAALKLARASSK